MHIYIAYVALLARSFEIDKFLIDFLRAFVVEYMAARAWKKIEEEA